MPNYNVIIRLLDGDSITLKNCTGYAVSEGPDCFRVDFASGYRAFFNKNAVAFIGREFDIKQDKET